MWIYIYIYTAYHGSIVLFMMSLLHRPTGRPPGQSRQGQGKCWFHSNLDINGKMYCRFNQHKNDDTNRFGKQISYHCKFKRQLFSLMIVWTTHTEIQPGMLKLSIRDWTIGQQKSGWFKLSKDWSDNIRFTSSNQTRTVDGPVSWRSSSGHPNFP